MSGESFHEDVYSKDAEMWLDIACFRVGDDQIGISFYDNSEKMNNFKKIEQHEKELNAIYEGAPVVMMLVNSDRKVQKINRKALDYVGKDLDAVIDKRGGEVFRCIHTFDSPLGCGYGKSCSDCTIRNTVLDTLITGQSFSGVEGRLHVSVDDEECFVDVLISTSPLILNNEPHALVCVQDITEQKKIQKQLDDSLKAVESANELKNHFLANLNHEIRTPLNAIVGFAEVISSKPCTDEFGELPIAVLDAADQLTKIVDDLILLSDFEVQINEALQNKFHLMELVKEVVENVASHHKKLINIRNHYSDISVYIGPVELIRVVIRNLVDNALKFSNEKDIFIELFKIDQQESYDLVQIIVEDYGIGIEDEQLTKIFGLFHQADQTYSRKYGGLGIGLPIVSRIVSSLNGEVSISSKLNQGTRVSISLRLTKER